MADEIKDDPFRGFLEALAKIDLNYRGVDNMKKHDFKMVTPKFDPDNVHAHLEVCGELNVTYERKNADYGDSFAQSLDKHGLIASIVRMDDKLNRVTSLNNSGDIQVTDESLRDTVMDLANYAIMTVMWMDSIKEEHKKIDIDEEYRLGRHPKYDIYADNLKLTGADYDGDTINS